MSEVDGIDERRCRAMAELRWPDDAGNWRRMLDADVCMDIARAIRLSDEAAGYIIAKLEGTVNEKDRKG